MFHESEPREYHSAIVDVTDKCNLRCRHCFYYREEHASEDMDAEEFLAGLRELRDRHNIMSMGWCGGEPLYRKDVLLEGSKLFLLNTIYTNGTIPIPAVDNAVVVISIDGPPEIHDAIRGKDTYRKIMTVLGSPEMAGRPVMFLSTINTINAPHLERMVETLCEIPTSLVGFNLFTPLVEYKDVKGYKFTEEQKTRLNPSWEERDDIIDRLLTLRKRFPGHIFNPDRTLELMRQEHAAAVTAKCNMPRRTLTLDLKLNRKLPCVLGRDVDCSMCGCVFPYLQQSKKEGDPESVALRF